MVQARILEDGSGAALAAFCLCGCAGPAGAGLRGTRPADFPTIRR